MTEATQKQIEYAREIAEVLNIELPKEKTAYAYYHFIYNNVQAYKKAKKNYRVYDIDEEWGISSMYPEAWFF